MADEPATESTPPVVPAGPWQSDIEATFTDPQVRSTVDAFLRSRIQPRMTQLEQQVSQTENARALWEAFQENPAAAYAEITRELYGEEAARVALDAVQQNLNPPAPAPAAPAPQAPPAAPQYDPNTALSPDEVQAWRREQELRQYDAAVADVLADPANTDIDPDLYHTYVAAADGDFNEAIVRYRDHVTKMLTRYGIDPTQATAAQQGHAAALAEAEARGTAPPVVGNDAGGAVSSATPTQADYQAQGLSPQQALHKAIEDAAAQTRRNADAPPVAG